MVRRFEVIDHTADIGIAAYGETLKEAFANAAYALFSLIVDNFESVGDSECREVEITSADGEELLVAWLNELIYIFEVENMLFRRFEIGELNETGLRASCYGEKINPERHKIRMVVKGATYHMLKIGEGDGFRVQVVFDV